MGHSALLTIAGYDPSSGAGVTADLAVFAAHHFFGVSAITALTVQSTLGVRAVQRVEPALLAETLTCLHEDLPPAGIKIGMLADAAHVHAVCDYLESHAPIPVVLDPVMISSSGRELLDPAGIDALRTRLLPLVSWVTPNRAELAVLTGCPAGDTQAAARELARRFPGLNVIATGGDHEPPDDFVLTAEGESSWLGGTRVPGNATHGTGCAFSSALLCQLIAGNPLAPQAAKDYVRQAIATAIPRGRGKGPMNLLWPLESV